MIGPAGSGKGTVAKKVARKLGLVNIDTGITYRTVALESINQNIDINDVEGLIKIAKEIDIKIIYGQEVDRVFLESKEITEEIRSTEVTAIVSQISSIPEIRYEMIKIQRGLAKRKKSHCRR